LSRTYERTHPWLKFDVDLRSASTDVWMLLGEAQSKCEHVAGVPLRPTVAQQLHMLFLAKGVRATTAIEGNTLTEQQVLEHLEGRLELPHSKAYLKQEIDNIVRACNEIWKEVLTSPAPQLLTSERIRRFNAIVLHGLKLEEHVQPGHIRTYDVGVGTYNAAPHQDCDHLLERLCEWLNGPQFRVEAPKPDRVVVFAILKAILAHLYLAWIHPFGDGNGRTARLVEFYILVGAGVRTPCAHLLSNFYNETRTEYYRQLDYASKSGGNVIPFLTYAIEGLVDGLREQIETIRQQQWDVTWRNYVHEMFRGPETTSDKRQKHLILDLSTRTEPVPRTELPLVSPRVAEAYAKKGPRTLARDIATLEKRGLLVRTEKGYLANRNTILAFLPARAQPPNEQPSELPVASTSSAAGEAPTTHAL
jgi:Fic family protein